MSSLAEIQNAVLQLPVDEQRALSAWISSQLDEQITSPEEERLLLADLDESLRQADAGKVVPLEEVRKMIPSWISK